MNILRQSGSIAVSLFLLSAPGWADTISLPVTDDSFIIGARPSANYGAWDDIFVTSYGPKQGLVGFDAASLAGLDIGSATLNLYLGEMAEGGAISIHAITSSWDEATVTWNNQPPAESTPTIVVNFGITEQDLVVKFDVTSVVQRWANGSLADAGFLIVTANNMKAYFDAKEKVGGIPATLEVETGPPAYSGEAIVLDLSDPDGCTIDEPGHYMLDRSWLLTPDGEEEPNASCDTVYIKGNGEVTLDLRGFAIRRGDFASNYEPVLWIETESGVTLRNGTLEGTFVAVEATVTGGTVYLDRIRSGGGVLLSNRRVIVTGGRYSGYWEAPLQVGEDSSVVGAAFLCDVEACLFGHGLSLIRNCTFSAENPYGVPAFTIGGDNTIVDGIVFDSWVAITGNGNIVTRNIATAGGVYIEVNGAGNILEGNIGPGIDFKASGNFYGNNRVALPGSITGTAGNVDWGGNVSY